MTTILISRPVGEPVPLAEAKVFLRIDHAEEDALVESLITAARQHVESVTGRALLTQGWRTVLDAWPAKRVVRIPAVPLPPSMR